MDENVFRLSDVVAASSPPAQAQEFEPNNIINLIDKIVSTVSSFQQKTEKFKSAYGRPPANKDELKTGRVLVNPEANHTQPTITAPQPVANESELLRAEITRLEAELKNLKSEKGLTMEINKEKLNKVFDDTIEQLMDLAKGYENLTVKELLNKYKMFKPMIKPKILGNFEQAIMSVIEYGKKEKDNKQIKN